MGKRKRRIDRNKTPPSPAFVSHNNSQMEPSLKEKSSHSFGSTGGARPTSSSLMNVVERSPHAHHQSSSTTHHRHHNFNRALLSRVPRHYYNIQHSQKNNANHSGTSSTSHGKSTLRDDKPNWKYGHRPESGFGYFAGRKDKGSRRMDRIRSNPLVMDVISPEVMSMVCGLCQQRTGDYTVVAVLVCGHIYHADCLEIRTHREDRRDPPCPLCTRSVVDN